jgi:hypothetical protein
LKLFCGEAKNSACALDWTPGFQDTPSSNGGYGVASPRSPNSGYGVASPHSPNGGYGVAARYNRSEPQSSMSLRLTQ